MSPKVFFIGSLATGIPLLVNVLIYEYYTYKQYQCPDLCGYYITKKLQHARFAFYFCIGFVIVQLIKMLY